MIKLKIDLEKYFGSYSKSNIDKLIKYLQIMDDNVTNYQNFGKSFFSGDSSLDYNKYLENRFLNYEPMKTEDIFKYIAPLYQNLPNWNNPGTMINVIPPVNLVSLACKGYAELYNPNFAQDSYSGFLIVSEMEVSKYISELVSWDWKKSFGIFTFGGKGTNLYATKIALTKADSKSINNGCNANKYFMITSKNAHPCHYEVCNWLGIGKNNCIEIECDNEGIIDIDKTRDVIRKNISEGKVFLGFNLNGGSTNELIIDPIEKISNLNDEITKEFNLNYKPHIHVDSVLSWIYLFFSCYDFDTNQLKIQRKQLGKILSLTQKVQELKYADSIGIDFHKTGFCPYISSLFLVKEKNDLNLLNPNKKIISEEMKYGEYNPFEFTLELTRASGGAISALTTLKSLGIKGFQEIIAKMFQSTEIFRNELRKNKNVCILNLDTEWLTTMFIIKPPKYEKIELHDLWSLSNEEICEIRQYNLNYAKYIYHLSRNNMISFYYTASRSYKILNTNINIGAIKAYPMSVFLSETEIKRIISEVNTTIENYTKISQNMNFESDTIINDTMVYRDNK